MVIDEGDPLPFRLDVAFQLYSDLIAPIRNQIQGKHLLIVAGRSLSRIPFGVFATHAPQSNVAKDPKEYERIGWLAKEFAMDSLPSVGSLHFTREFAAKNDPSEQFVGFGTPKLAGSKDCPRVERNSACTVDTAAHRSFVRLNRVGEWSNLPALCPLPETETELRCISGSLHAQASASLSEKGELAKYKVIDFATHGLLPTPATWQTPGMRRP